MVFTKLEHEEGFFTEASVLLHQNHKVLDREVLRCLGTGVAQKQQKGAEEQQHVVFKKKSKLASIMRSKGFRFKFVFILLRLWISVEGKPPNALLIFHFTTLLVRLNRIAKALHSGFWSSASFSHILQIAQDLILAFLFA